MTFGTRAKYYRCHQLRHLVTSFVLKVKKYITKKCANGVLIENKVAFVHCIRMEKRTRRKLTFKISKMQPSTELINIHFIAFRLISQHELFYALKHGDTKY